MLGREVVGLLSAWGVEHAGTDLELDITCPDLVEAQMKALRPTHVINCAAYTNVDGAETNEERARALNGEAPEHLGRAAAKRGSLVVHISTDYVFDGRARRPYREDDPPAPANAYGRTKLLGEEGLLAAHERSYVVRTSWLFGAQGPNFVATMLGLLSERETLSVVDDQRGRPTHALDLARACLALVGLGPQARAQAAPGIYHYANQGDVTWHGFTEGIREAALERGLPVVTQTIEKVSSEAFPRPAPRPSWSVLDTHKIEALLEGSPPTWQAALREYLDLRERSLS